MSRQAHRKVRSGDEFNFPAALQNDLVDLLSAGQAGNGFSPGLVGNAAQGVVVNVKNTSGSDRRQWDTMALGNALRFTLGTLGRESVIFDAITSDPAKPPAILQEPIANNKFGRALIFGYTLARVAAGSATTFSGRPNASSKLDVDAGGSVRFLAAPSASVETIVPVLLGAGSGGGAAIIGITRGGGLAGRTTTAVPHTFPSATIDLLDPSTGNWFSPPQAEIVYNSTSIAIAAGHVVQAKKIGARYFVDVDDCA